MVHAVPAARSGMKVIRQCDCNNNESRGYNFYNFLNKTGGYSPTTEAQTGAGEVLIRKEAAVGYKLTCNFSIEALTQRL